MSGSGLALALVLWAAPAAPAPLPPLACPEGTEHRGGQPLEGFEEWCAVRGPDGNERREGPARAYYEDGRVWTESRWHDGKLDGPFLERHRNGRKAREGAYQAGERHGRWTYWYEDGSLQEESGWSRGVPDGAFADYWPGGRPRNTGRHCVGLQCGQWKAFDERGNLVSSVEYGEVRATP